MCENGSVPAGKFTLDVLSQRIVPFGAWGYSQATKSVADCMCWLMGCKLLMLRLCTDVDVCIGQVTTSPSAAAAAT